jgi:hypothetical protein
LTNESDETFETDATDECLEMPPHVSKIQFEKYSLGNQEKNSDNVETISKICTTSKKQKFMKF